MKLSLSFIFSLSLSLNAAAQSGRATNPVPAAPPVATVSSEGPVGPVRMLGEWEDSEAIMVAWPNASLVSEYAARNRVLILADTETEQSWWNDWLTQRQIAHRGNISYLAIPNDSIWIRDYGPWYILDGRSRFGLVDPTYFKSRSVDDQFPQKLGELLKVPVYPLGVSIEGGNFVTDGGSTAFSSTSINYQNAPLTVEQVNAKFASVAGINKYERFKLGDSDTKVVHIDTFAKPLSPDTWMIAQFPEGSKYRVETEALAEKIQSLPSGYGTKNRIFRMPMIPKAGTGGTNVGEKYYRGYINSFISNRALYFPVYGGPEDERARLAYQAALPGYEIVGIDAKHTWWSDAVHCRSRNLLKRDTLFLFNRLVEVPAADEEMQVFITAHPSPGAAIRGFPRIHWRAGNGPWQVAEAERHGRVHYFAALPGHPAGTPISYYVEATDTHGRTKTVPPQAPVATIDFTVKSKELP